MLANYTISAYNVHKSLHGITLCGELESPNLLAACKGLFSQLRRGLASTSPHASNLLSNWCMHHPHYTYASEPRTNACIRYFLMCVLKQCRKKLRKGCTLHRTLKLLSLYITFHFKFLIGKTGFEPIPSGIRSQPSTFDILPVVAPRPLMTRRLCRVFGC